MKAIICWWLWAGAVVAYIAHKPDAHAAGCNAALLAHVYKGRFKVAIGPSDGARLQVLDGCVSVSGTVETAKREPDGDVHIQLKLDSQFGWMLNAKNKSGQDGYLVVEPVCQGVVEQADAKGEKVCSTPAPQLWEPGMLHHRVSVLGPFVLDREHGWQEIHPPSKIEFSR